jgi:hypothetical protein
MKTTVQNYYEDTLKFIDEVRTGKKTIKSLTTHLVVNHSSWIDDEKKALIDAYGSGLTNIECNECACLGHESEMSDNYYNETFSNEN